MGPLQILDCATRFHESLNEAFIWRCLFDLPLLLPANLKAANVLMMPNTSCVKAVTIFPCDGSGL